MRLRRLFVPMQPCCTRCAAGIVIASVPLLRHDAPKRTNASETSRVHSLPNEPRAAVHQHSLSNVQCKWLALYLEAFMSWKPAAASCPGRKRRRREPVLHGCRAWGEQDARARGLQPETDTAALSGVIAHWDSSKAEHGYGFTRAWWRPMITCSAWNRSPAQFIRGTSCKRDLLKRDA